MEENKTLDFLTQFPPVSTQSWEEKIFTDLKGADYEKKLIWKSDEGFNVKPYYRSEDLAGLEYLQALPDEPPYVRGVKRSNNDWLVRQDILVSDIEGANRQALDAISRGAKAVGLDASEVSTHKQMSQLLSGIDLTKTGVYFIRSRSYPLTLELFIYEVNHRGEGGELIQGAINFDPISYLLFHGDFYVSWIHNIGEAEYLLTTSQKRLPHFRSITINGHFFQNSGSSLVQELAFSLASASEYLLALTEKGYTADFLSSRMMFSLAVGSNYFMEIAKLRAMRLLWARLVEQYHPETPAAMKTFIHASTARWNKTIYDPYVNMLRTTTEGMSAALGNADSVSVTPFDVAFKGSGDFSDRIARNQQLILKEESYLNKVADPGAGSYYIENLTHSMAHHAWALFQEVEAKGGMIECVKTGFIQDQVMMIRRQKEADIAQRKIVLIGTNQYPNTQETMLNSVEMAVEDESTESPYKKLTHFRIASEFEMVRLATEKHVKTGNKRPSVFLFTMGNLAFLRARAGFASNFFGCAGYEIIDNPGFSAIAEGVEAAMESRSEIVVICSSDEEYSAIVPEIAKQLKSGNPKICVVVAGYPKEIVDFLKDAGVDDFIHVRSNLLESLKRYQNILGIQ
jgi:methylmalonyl-CoA mutase